jgi:hypothetical protein
VTSRVCMSANPDSFAPGVVVCGTYRLVSVLGRGRHGVVWSGVDGAGGVVAVKVEAHAAQASRRKVGAAPRRRGGRRCAGGAHVPYILYLYLYLYLRTRAGATFGRGSGGVRRGGGVP